MTETKMEIKMAVIETEVKGLKSSLKTHIDEQREDFNKIHSKLDTFISSADGKYASQKDVDTINTRIWGIAGGVVLALLGVVVFFLKNKFGGL